MTTTRRANSLFAKGSGMYECRCCHRKTRHTGGDGAGVQLCDTCYELAGEENSLSDNDAFYESPENVLAMIASVAAKGGDASCWADIKAAAEKIIAAKQAA